MLIIPDIKRAINFNFLAIMKGFTSRRKAIKSAGLGLAALVTTPYISASAKKAASVPEGLTILMQGDSITDAGRDRARYYANDASGMGRGYVHQVVAQMMGEHPDKSFRFYNRGISGNKVYQLSDRWDDDALQLKPDVLSILIGVNDFWHTLRNYDGTVETYSTDLQALLERTMKALPDVKLIMGEPFAVAGGSAIDEKWYPEFPEYQKAARQLAADFNAEFIPYQQVFSDALKVAPASYWCPDGVHPSMAGAYLMKEAWIAGFNNLFS